MLEQEERGLRAVAREPFEHDVRAALHHGARVAWRHTRAHQLGMEPVLHVNAQGSGFHARLHVLARSIRRRSITIVIERNIFDT